MVHNALHGGEGEGEGRTLISPQFLLFWASAWPAGHDSQIGTVDCVRNGPRRVGRFGREASMRGVSSGSISDLPGATFPVLLVYLRPTKHRSLSQPVRPLVRLM